MEKQELEEVKQKLVDKLTPSGWADKLRDFITGPEMDKILIRLNQDDHESGFTPPLRSVFNAFESCSYNELKVVFCGLDPYPRKGMANGRAFCCANTGKLQPSLQYLLQEVQRTIYKGEGYHYNPDLTHWANQGVLLINTAFTTTTGTTGQHLLLWRPFLTHLLYTISSVNPGLIYVFFGAVAQKHARLVPDNTYKIMVTHPASAAYQNADTWNSEDLFLKVNQILHKNNGLKIIW